MEYDGITIWILDIRYSMLFHVTPAVFIGERLILQAFHRRGFAPAPRARHPKRHWRRRGVGPSSPGDGGKPEMAISAKILSEL